MENNIKNNKGFTLTELIVVIVIIGILAAVLIPSLTGYVKKANENAALQEASSFVTVYNSYLIEETAGTLPNDVSTLGDYAYQMKLISNKDNLDILFDNIDGNQVYIGFEYKGNEKYNMKYTSSTGQYEVSPK